MDVTIVDNEIDRLEMQKVMDAYNEMLNGDLSREEWNDRDKYPRKQWLDFDEDAKVFPFTVVDNREGECFVEGFATIDGAILYICECYQTCENQIDWDYMGAVKDRGWVDEKGDDNEYVIKCPIGLCGTSFVFGYVKDVSKKGSTSDMFTENIDEAFKFGRRRDAVKAAKDILQGKFDEIKNVVLVTDERKAAVCT